MDTLASSDIVALLKGNRDLLNKFQLENNDSHVVSDKFIKGRIEIVDAIRIPKYLIFRNCIFENEIVFGEMVSKVSITFQDCEFVENVSFKGGDFEKAISFMNCHFFESSLSFSEGIFDKVIIDKGCIETLEFYGGKYSELYIGSFTYETIIKDLFINCSRASGKINLYKLTCYEVNITGILNENDTLNIIQCYIQNFLFKEFTNNGKFRLSKLRHFSLYYNGKNLKGDEFFKNHFRSENCVEEKLFLIIDSVIGKAELFSINFSYYKFVCIAESSLVDVVISNVIWPEKIDRLPTVNAMNPEYSNLSKLRERIIEYRKVKIDYNVSRENYRQLKFACGRQGDFIGEQHFHSLEMRAYNISLRWKDKLLTKLILKFSYWTSDYGQSIKKPILCLLIGHLLLFLIALIGGGFENMKFTITLFAGMESGIEKYLTYINPLRNATVTLPGYLMIVDITMRIWSSYMIYNVIRASRRFLK